MSFFDHAQNTLVQGDMTATHNGNVYNAEVTTVAYQVAPLKGVLV